MTPLEKHLHDLIAAQGPIPVSSFMELALGHPEHGYYMARDPFGRGGDFITAPEISQMFGELVGLWAADLWQQMGQPKDLKLIELGPGRGTLMADARRAIARTGWQPSIWLVETSPALRTLQQTRLPGATWVDHLDKLPQGPAIVLANEFFDALPIQQFVNTTEGWRERLVASTGAAFRFCLAAGASPMAAALADRGTMPNGVLIELCPLGLSLVRLLADRFVPHGGAALVIDYGHIKPGTGDTLQAVRAHQFAPVLEAPGEADLTAHVDFSALAQAARQAGANVHGPVTQEAFLTQLGLPLRATALKKATPGKADEIDTAVRRLMHADEMGVLFKALALTGPGVHPAGFG